MRQTLPKSSILRGYQSFTTVITGGVPYHGTLLSAFVLSSKDDMTVQIGFAVPKKQVPLAARRNRIKRLMREAVRMQFMPFADELRTRGAGARIVLMFRRPASRDILRLTLHEITSAWSDLQLRIRNAS